jgi:hypothetical protein
MQLLLTYPFADSNTAAMRGDYTNMQANLELSLEDLAGSLGLPTAPPGGTPTPPGPGLPSLPSLPSLPTPTLPDLPGPTLPGGTSPKPPPPPPCSIPILCPGGAS